MMSVTRIEKRIGLSAHFRDGGIRGRRALPLAGVLVAAGFICGCGGVVSGQNTRPTTPTTQTYSISGTIAPSSGGSGATITLSGAASATTTGDSSGNYSFTGLANGTYAVSPGNRGFTFSPTSQNATVNGANITGVNFTATPQPVHSVALTWNASTSTVSGYNVYRSTLSGGSYLRINSSLVAGLSYTDSTVQNTTTYYYVTTAVDSTGTESVYSNQVSAAIP
jgi:SdrD B-like domain